MKRLIAALLIAPVLAHAECGTDTININPPEQPEHCVALHHFEPDPDVDRPGPIATALGVVGTALAAVVIIGVAGMGRDDYREHWHHRDWR